MISRDLWAAAALVLAGLAISACGGGNGDASDSRQLSPTESQRVIDAQVAIGRYCKGGHGRRGVERAIDSLIAVYGAGPERLFTAATPTTIRSLLMLEARQLARCGLRAEAAKLRRALAGG